jgi:cobalt/nickel transport system permease protein
MSVTERRDARVKLVALLLTLGAIATSPSHHWLEPVLLGMAAILLASLSGISPGLILRKAIIVALFTTPFALMVAVSGDPPRAAALFVRTYACAVTILLFIQATSLPEILHALRWFRIPPLLLEVIQFVYRYLSVIEDQAHRMRTAANARGRLTWRAGAGILGVLFARSFQRAEYIHRAMLSRGYTGDIVPLSIPAPRRGDFFFLAVVTGAIAAVRMAT